MASAGFTLVELLIAIVVVGVLVAVAVVGINGLVDRGENSACRVTLDAANHAAAAYYARRRRRIRRRTTSSSARRCCNPIQPSSPRRQR